MRAILIRSSHSKRLWSFHFSFSPRRKPCWKRSSRVSHSQLIFARFCEEIVDQGIQAVACANLWSLKWRSALVDDLWLPPPFTNAQESSFATGQVFEKHAMFGDPPNHGQWSESEENWKGQWVKRCQKFGQWLRLILCSTFTWDDWSHQLIVFPKRVKTTKLQAANVWAASVLTQIDLLAIRLEASFSSASLDDFQRSPDLKSALVRGHHYASCGCGLIVCFALNRYQIDTGQTICIYRHRL